MHAWKACELTVSPTSHMALEVGLEPTTDRLTADCSTNWAIQAYSIKWSGWWESNPRSQLGRLKFYHWTTPALNGAQGRSRTGTDFKVRRILSPVRLPVSPPGQHINGGSNRTRTDDNRVAVCCLTNLAMEPLTFCSCFYQSVSSPDCSFIIC